MKKLLVKRLFRIFLIICTLLNIRYIYFSVSKGFFIAFPRVKHGYNILSCLYALTFVEWLSQTTALIVKCPLSIDKQLSIPFGQFGG